MPRKNKSTHFVFTSYLLTRPFYDTEKVRKLVYQREVCPKTQRFHWQAAVEFYDEQTTKQAQKILCIGNSHMEFMRGTVEDQKYCKKTETSLPNTYVEYGEAWTPNTNARYRGERSNLLENACKSMLSGGWKDVSDSDIVKYHRGLSFLRLVRTEAYEGPRECWWLYGESGSNKTKYAVEYLKSLGVGPIYWAPNTGGWFDGYDLQECVLIDELDKHQYTTSEFLRMTDRYPFKVKTKGGHEPFQARYVMITSHHPPEYFFPADRMKEIIRRIQIVELGSEGG